MVYLVSWCQGLPDFTNAYQPMDLGKTSGPCAFTKHHRLVITTDIIYCYNVLDELLMVGY